MQPLFPCQQSCYKNTLKCLVQSRLLLHITSFARDLIPRPPRRLLLGLSSDFITMVARVHYIAQGALQNFIISPLRHSLLWVHVAANPSIS